MYGNVVTPYTVREVLTELADIEDLFKLADGELASSHLSVRPSIQPEVATYRLLLDVITSTVGDDDIVERGALRDARINRRITFLADEISLSSMSEEEVSVESEGESVSDTWSGHKRQRIGSARKMDKLKKDSDELKKENKELKKEVKKLKKDHEKVDARNSKLGPTSPLKASSPHSYNTHRLHSC